MNEIRRIINKDISELFDKKSTKILRVEEWLEHFNDRLKNDPDFRYEFLEAHLSFCGIDATPDDVADITVTMDKINLTMKNPMEYLYMTINVVDD